jgi:hypothetical protein
VLDRARQRPLADLMIASNHTLGPASSGLHEAADNLLRKAVGAVRDGDGTRARRFVERALELPFDELSRLLPGGLPDKLRNDPGALGRTEELVVTVLRSDVRGYSGIAERHPPAVLATLLNEHRAAILAHGGTVMQVDGRKTFRRMSGHFPRGMGPSALQPAVSVGWCAVGD